MVSKIEPSNEICSRCSALLSAGLRHCPACQLDIGAPNVRASCSKENIEKLELRFVKSQNDTQKNNCSMEFDSLQKNIIDKSGVVISMPIEVVSKLINDPREIYSNYERLVGAGVRTPASHEYDHQRCAIAGQIFGSYADSICYGTLSLTNQGLPTYGHVYCRMRSITIKDRTSFLDTNSYKFISDHQITTGGRLPAGYMACWENRHLLVMAKLADRLRPNQTESDWQTILVESNGVDRLNDNFIEAHIFEGFNKDSIETLQLVPGKKLDRIQKLQLDIIFSKHPGHKRSVV